jgi:hypothetical protein
MTSVMVKLVDGQSDVEAHYENWVEGGCRFVGEALAKPPRDMGVPPMKHGQDARATPARKGFCRIF